MGNVAVNNTRNMTDTITNTITSTIQQSASNTKLQQKINTWCTEDVAKADLKSRDACVAGLVKAGKADLAPTLCQLLCSATDVQQNATMNVQNIHQSIAKNSQKIQQAVASAITNDIQKKGGGLLPLWGIEVSNVDNVSKAAVNAVSKVQQNTFDDLDVVQEIDSHGLQLKHVSQKAVADVLNKSLQKSSTYQSAIQDISNKIAAHTKVESTSIGIIVLVVLVVLGVGGYIYYRYHKKKKCIAAGGTWAKGKCTGGKSGKK